MSGGEKVSRWRWGDSRRAPGHAERRRFRRGDPGERQERWNSGHHDRRQRRQAGQIAVAATAALGQAGGFRGTEPLCVPGRGMGALAAAAAGRRERGQAGPAVSAEPAAGRQERGRDEERQEGRSDGTSSASWHRDRSGAPAKPGSHPIIRFPTTNRNRTSAARPMEGSTQKYSGPPSPCLRVSVLVLFPTAGSSGSSRGTGRRGGR
jgi:hypothetical protein